MKKSGNVLLIFLGLVITIGVSASVAYYYASSGLKQPGNASAATLMGHGQTFGPILDVGEFTVNLKGDSSFLKTDISLELADKNVADEMKDTAPILKDKIIDVLASKTLQDVSSTSGKEKLKQELLMKINSVLGASKVKQVLFTSYVYQ